MLPPDLQDGKARIVSSDNDIKFRIAVAVFGALPIALTVIAFSCSEDAVLTAREKQLLRRLVRGWSDLEIARQIGGTERQIAAQREALLKKLQIKSEAQLKSAAEELAPWKSKKRGEDGGNGPPP